MATKVLIVEDDKDIRRNLKRLLESEGYLVDSAENGKAALDVLEAAVDLPSFIILDLMMPIMDGFQFREHQKQNHRFASIPVAIMTADGRIGEKQRSTGASAALRKPADADAILKMVAQFCAKN